MQKLPIIEITIRVRTDAPIEMLNDADAMWGALDAGFDGLYRFEIQSVTAEPPAGKGGKG